MADQQLWPGGRLDQDEQKHLLSLEVRQYIIKAFCPHSKSSIAEYDSYFKYFRWTILVLAWHHHQYGLSNEDQLAVQTYADLAKIVRRISQLMDCNRISVAQELQKDFPTCSEKQISRSIDLAVRLWLTIHVRVDNSPIGSGLSEITELSWPDSVSLRSLVGDAFGPIAYSMHTHAARIEPSFTVKNLSRLCRIRIQWTANLKDHLRYDRNAATLYLFPHKICLISHLESDEVLPKELVAETIKTLDLLFPFGKESTQKILDETGQSFYRTSSRDLSRPLDFGEFRYWRKRLLELHDVYNEAPRSVLQMWYDRRNPIQWWTFWLAAAIAVISIVFGAISSYTGFKQVDLAQKSYDLAVVQACSQSNPPSFCKT